MLNSFQQDDFSEIKILEQSVYSLENQKKEIDAEIQLKQAQITTVLTKYYTLSEASYRLRTNEKNIARAIQNKKYTGFKVGNRYYVSREEVDDETEILNKKEEILCEF